MKKLRVWWIPQVPGQPFYVEVETVNEASKIITVLQDYDAFQLAQNIKPDYSNAGGLEVLVEEPNDWEEWYSKTTDEDIHEVMARDEEDG